MHLQTGREGSVIRTIELPEQYSDHNTITVTYHDEGENTHVEAVFEANYDALVQLRNGLERLIRQAVERQKARDFAERKAREQGQGRDEDPETTRRRRRFGGPGTDR